MSYSVDLTMPLAFKEMIDIYPVNSNVINQLPVCHTTTWGAYDQISHTNKISCDTVCDVYNEKLIYFFYGKANYANKENNVPTITNEDPITLIYDLSEISQPLHRVLPFDSGGFPLYKFKNGFKLEGFTYYQPDRDILQKLIKIFYETNNGYRKKQLSKSIIKEYKEICRPLKELIGLYESSGYGKKQYGDRAFTFEIQFKELDIEIIPKIIILPFSYYDEEMWPEFKAAFQKKGIKLEYYNDDESYINGTDSYQNMKKKVLALLDEFYND